MKRTLFCTVLLLSSASALAGATSYNQRGDHAYGAGVIDHGDGCTWTQVTVWYGDGMSMGGGKPTTYTQSTFWYDTYDDCAGTYIWTDGTTTEATYSSNSSGATLAGTAALTEWFTGDSLGEISFSVTWTASGTSSKGISNWSYNYPGGMYRYRSVGTTTDATFGGTANGYTLGSGWGSYGTSTTGSLSVYTH